MQTYIVQLHPHDEGDSGEAMLSASKFKVDWHLSFLERYMAWEQEKRPSSCLLYSYHTVFDGFAAQLTDGEAAALRVLPGVVLVRADRRVKLIGARFYSKGHCTNYSTNPSEVASLLEYVSPWDAHGHGTHTASMVAGAAVVEASVLGAGLGEARGVAPGAHVAVYKVCWFNGCYSSDIVAGMDDAVRDSVDVLSLSLDGFPIPLFEDSIAIGSFRTTVRGVSIVCTAGNNGPARSSVANEVPWVLTVGAGGEGN